MSQSQTSHPIIPPKKEIPERFPFQEVEPKWQKRWEEEKSFAVDTGKGEKTFYCLEMFPYPSGKLHMGHLRNYAIGDVMARFYRMKGYEVLHPMGFDAFGLPAENAAIARKTHPSDWTYANIREMTQQQIALGLSYDWDRKVVTCDEEYYRWGQWLFLKFWEKGLVYRKEGLLNWCPQCETVLANEQVISGLCWRCDSVVKQKYLPQWYVKITAYAEELLQGLERLGEWPQKVLLMQRNWIGRSEGAEIVFRVAEGPLVGKEIPVFTTRPDTIFGATYMVLAPEHPLVDGLIAGTKEEASCRTFIEQVSRMDKASRTDEATVKEGVFTGQWAINPVNGEKVPIWIANYVLVEYGTGAIMAVPTHDQRDFEFAKKYDLPMRLVIRPENAEFETAEEMTAAWEGAGTMVNSGSFDGTPNDAGKKKITEWMAKQKIGRATVNYRLRDWGISRQRYWGMPIPLIHCDDCGIVPVPESELPVQLPYDIELTGEGSPLKRHAGFLNVPCPTCHKPARRESDTIDTFWDSSWYFLRYIDAVNQDAPFATEKVNRWMPVDLYIGGVEHAVLHLLYSRFFTMALRDMGLVQCDEPFKKLVAQGMVTKDGFKMSKSKGNVVDPGEIITRYGADAARLFILFTSPPERDLEWSDEGVIGSARFIDRVYRLVARYMEALKEIRGAAVEPSENALRLRRLCHATIQNVTRDIEERMNLNTAIAKIMELINEMYRVTGEAGVVEGDFAAFQESVETVILLLSPFAPHLAEELWEMIGHTGAAQKQAWPAFNSTLLVAETVTLIVQVNGKVRGKVSMPMEADENAIWEAVRGDSQISRWLENMQVVKKILVPGKLLNLVVKSR